MTGKLNKRNHGEFVERLKQADWRELVAYCDFIRAGHQMQAKARAEELLGEALVHGNYHESQIFSPSPPKRTKRELVNAKSRLIV